MGLSGSQVVGLGLPWESSEGPEERVGVNGGEVVEIPEKGERVQIQTQRCFRSFLGTMRCPGGLASSTTVTWLFPFVLFPHNRAAVRKLQSPRKPLARRGAAPMSLGGNLLLAEPGGAFDSSNESWWLFLHWVCSSADALLCP